MSRFSDLANEIRNVVSDAIPDPPRIAPTISIDANNDLDRKIPRSKNSQDDRPSDNNSNDASTTTNTVNPDDDDNDEDSTASKKTNSPKVSTNKPKRASKQKKTANPSISYNIVNSQDISIGPKIKYVYNLNNNNIHNVKGSSVNNDKFEAETSEPKVVRDMLPHIKTLSTSQLEITKEDMLQVKTHMGLGWKQVAKCIGYSKGQIEQFSDNYKRIDETVYQLLLDWKQSCPKSATVGRLITAMWSSEEYDCAEILAAAHVNTHHHDKC
ncbi:myb-like protein A [Copidosoma floridanum]|uniref:myb-like protein A n=1 Tax=Copidosoma floridanum TaxID=29053 RepID=UPI0006C98BDC|nr:myb-like protein A [Copidosoma floridanum]